MRIQILATATTLALALSGCSKSSDHKTEKPSAPSTASKTAPGTPAEANAPSARAAAAAKDAEALAQRKFEKIEELETVFGDKLATAKKQLELASELSLKDYPNGNAISEKECQGIDRAISKNYKLIQAEVVTAKGYEVLKGSNICPTKTRHALEPATPDRVTSLYSGSVKTVLGREGKFVLSVSGSKANKTDDMTVQQIVLDKDYKIIERSLSYSNGYFEIASLDKEGHLLMKRASTATPKDLTYRMVSMSLFQSARGDLDATKTYRYDGRKVPLTVTSINMPYNMKFEGFEVTPLNYHGFYSVNGKVITWPNSQARLQIFEKAGVVCPNGSIGWDKNGSAIREFGDITCDKQMDAQITRGNI